MRIVCQITIRAVVVFVLMGQRVVHLPAGPTIANCLKKLPGSTPVLDHLFVRGMRPGANGVVRTTTASDHYPIWAVFYFE